MSIISKITDWVSTPYTIYLILKDPLISRPVKLRSAIGLGLIFAYMVSPIDIIPDFMPMPGLVDDLIVVPLGLALMRKFIPDISIMEKRNRAQASVRQILPWAIFSIVVAAFLVLVWLGVIIYIIVRLTTG